MFTKSCLKEKDTRVVGSAPSAALQVSALLAWTLLLTVCPVSEVKKRLEMCVPVASCFTNTLLTLMACVCIVTADCFLGISTSCQASSLPMT